jgi:hypothetical protein
MAPRHRRQLPLLEQCVGVRAIYTNIGIINPPQPNLHAAFSILMLKNAGQCSKPSGFKRLWFRQSVPLPVAHARPRLNPADALMPILTRLHECVVSDACNIACDINIGSGKLEVLLQTRHQAQRVWRSAATHRHPLYRRDTRFEGRPANLRAGPMSQEDRARDGGAAHVKRQALAACLAVVRRCAQANRLRPPPGRFPPSRR